MDEIQLVLIAGLELWLTAITVLLLSRRFRLMDAKRKRKLANLGRMRELMDAYLALLDCKYPDMREIAFAHWAPDPDHTDPTAPKRVYDALQEYRRVEAQFEQAERLVLEAWESLDDERWYERVASILISTISLLPFLPYVGPWNFTRNVRPHLYELSKQRRRIYDEFPESFAAWIDWDRLDYIDPADTFSIIHTLLKYKDKANLAGEAQYQEREISIADARDNLKHFRRDARRAIDAIYEEIRKREEKWLLPHGNGV